MLLPQTGQSVLVRNRLGRVLDVSEHVTHLAGQFHAVEVEYLDGLDHPVTESLIWELEPSASIIGRLNLPALDRRTSPIPPDAFQALLDALRWSSVGSSTMLDASSHTLLAPWHAAIQVEDYQLYPVLKALAVPRVSLLLADDVGLGKTIEAGLVLTELIARRRLRRILVLCPASLQAQWRDELREKFAMDFAVLDRDSAFALQQDLGTDANPWAATPRAITSMDYLRQADILSLFERASQGLTPADAGRVAWDLVIVDEAHNLAPSSFADDSQRCRMLRDILPHFEHRLFLTATPHNGYTQSFSGLLELLDPVRFQQKVVLTDGDRAQVHAVMVRRLKSELNARSTVPEFPKRHVCARRVEFGHQEEAGLFASLEEYRNEGVRIAARAGKREAHLARFLFSILTKRLLSSSLAFARTWWKHVVGYGMTEGDYEGAQQAADRTRSEIVDDAERAQREEEAVRHGAAWLRRHREELAPKAGEVSKCLGALGWGQEQVPAGESFEGISLPIDSRWDELWAWLQEHLLMEGGARKDERAIVFTEYKDTLDYLQWRLKTEKMAQPLVQRLVGGMPDTHRELIKAQFNDPEAPLRLLLATDAASEGLNFQRSCRYVFHQDIPWNPMRLEQRNGRVDRHGQRRETFVFHFTSTQQADLRFLGHVAGKVEQVREDLGSVGQVIDASVEENFTRRAVDIEEFDQRLEAFRDSASAATSGRDAGSEEQYEHAYQAFRAAEIELGLTPERMARVLSLALQHGQDALQAEDSPDGPQTYRLRSWPATWEKLVDDTVRIQTGPSASALPRLVFDPTYFEEIVDGRRVFTPRPNEAQLIRLGHPLMRRAVSHFRRSLWEKDERSGWSGWTLAGSALPHGTDAILVLHALVTATNDLRELLEESVVSWPFVVRGPELAPAIDELWSAVRHQPTWALAGEELAQWRERLADLWLDHGDVLKARLDDEQSSLEAHLRAALPEALEQAGKQERAAYERRLAELDTEKSPKLIEKLRKELAAAEEKVVQRSFDPEINQLHQERYQALQTRLEEAEFERQHSHLVLLKDRLIRDRDRLLTHLLPRRYTLARVDVQPIGVEYRVRAARPGGDHA